jgi:hypothetical protein
MASELAIDRQIEFLKLECDDDDPEVRNATRRIVNQAAQNVLMLKIRADEGSLRLKTVDRLGDILRLVAEEEQKLERA